ncbi:hypothetical protein EVJ58_g1929 [Rhodofomes roseus]|uniref:SH3 domain-containing protein n=1 Tax=Rhodofomes roseus TaxID=34475 RepID=A0A4Y9YUX0_9APHY|nr:hypothetical protein EVJ58_g1929 [Rhodofomes roseus]
MTERSSFGPGASHAPWETFSDSVGATAGGSAPSSRIELSVPPVGREMKGLTKPVWTSHLNGSMVFTPSLASLASSNVLPTIRSPDRTSWGSQKSMDKSSGEDGAWVSCPESAAVSTSSHGLPSSMSVRPFSPSEAWQFPKPPESRADDALPASYRRQSRASTRVVSPDSMFESGMSSEAGYAHVGVVDAETALHFARVEMIRRPFVPAMEDEMAVAPGDRVRMLRRFNDGWAYAEKVGTRRRGIIPIDCLRTPSEDLPAFLASKRLSSYRAGSVYAKSEEETGEPYVRFAI